MVCFVRIVCCMHGRATMKLFIDTADVAVIARWKDTGIIDGITTNPSNLSTVGQNPVEVVKKICALLPDGDISVEVTEKEPDAVYAQAKKIVALAPNIVVKIPCHRDYYAHINRLVAEGIAVNITLVFTLTQGILMSKLGVRYISPFVGRWDDIDVDGSELLSDLRNTIDRYGFETQILAASLRNLRHVHAALSAGADALTVPADLLEKMTTHILTESGIARFDTDWKSLKISTFP
jgi:transaldolase